jgi:stage II sporulation protein GA (sporulation sigma-E factor processing peptidase)
MEFYMQQTVYIDILFFINLVINYFILLAVTNILHRKDKRLRLFLGACLGAVYSLFIFFPELSFLYSSVLKFIFSVAIVVVAYKFSSIIHLVKLVLAFYIVSIIFGGIIFAMWLFLSPPGMLMKNGVVYVDISPVVLILASAACYIIITLFARFLHKNNGLEAIYEVEVFLGNVSVKITALLDTGNSLTDSISGLPVIITEFDKIEKLIPKALRQSFKKGIIDNPDIFVIENWQNRFRLIPYGSVGNTGGLLPAFKPDKIVAKSGENKIETSNVLVAVTNKRLTADGRYNMLLNPNLKNQSKLENLCV